MARYEQIGWQTSSLYALTSHAIWPYDIWIRVCICLRLTWGQIKLKSLHGNIKIYRRSHRDDTHIRRKSHYSSTSNSESFVEWVWFNLFSVFPSLNSLPPNVKALLCTQKETEKIVFSLLCRFYSWCCGVFRMCTVWGNNHKWQEILLIQWQKWQKCKK